MENCRIDKDLISDGSTKGRNTTEELKGFLNENLLKIVISIAAMREALHKKTPHRAVFQAPF